MKRYWLTAFIFFLGITSLSAEEKNGVFEFNNDRFVAGTKAVQDADGVDDLFMFGETVRSEKSITGSAHFFGRKVISNGDIGGDAYMAGMDISQNGKVAGDLTISGLDLRIGEVDGDLRASGKNVTLSGNVSGYAIVAAEAVRFDANVKSNVTLMAEEVKFSEGARIEGVLTVYEEKASKVTIPPQVIPEDRIERRDLSDWSEAKDEVEFWSWKDALAEFFTGVLIFAGIAAFIAAVAPQQLASLRRTILEQPYRTLWLGFLALSVAIGSIIVLFITGIGIILVPVAVVITLVGAFGGYIVGAYAAGVKMLLLAGQPEPGEFGTRALAAGAGTLAVALAGLIPFIGWLLVLAVAFAGLGAITVWLFQPRFLSAA